MYICEGNRLGDDRGVRDTDTDALKERHRERETQTHSKRDTERERDRHTQRETQREEYKESGLDLLALI